MVPNLDLRNAQELDHEHLSHILSINQGDKDMSIDVPNCTSRAGYTATVGQDQISLAHAVEINALQKELKDSTKEVLSLAK